MSTHVLDTSGARPLTSTVNDPAKTLAQVPARQGDDVAVSLGGHREIRLVLTPGTKIQRRQYVTKDQVVKEGKLVRDDAGQIVYKDTTSERLVLVLPGSLIVFGRSSVEDIGAGGWPHTHVTVKRQEEPHFTESGELLEELDLASLVPERDTRAPQTA